MFRWFTHAHAVHLFITLPVTLENSFIAVTIKLPSSVQSGFHTYIHITSHTAFNAFVSLCVCFPGAGVSSHSMHVCACSRRCVSTVHPDSWLKKHRHADNDPTHSSHSPSHPERVYHPFIVHFVCIHTFCSGGYTVPVYQLNITWYEGKLPQFRGSHFDLHTHIHTHTCLKPKMHF